MKTWLYHPTLVVCFITGPHSVCSACCHRIQVFFFWLKKNPSNITSWSWTWRLKMRNFCTSATCWIQPVTLHFNSASIFYIDCLSALEFSFTAKNLLCTVLRKQTKKSIYFKISFSISQFWGISKNIICKYEIKDATWMKRNVHQNNEVKKKKKKKLKSATSLLGSSSLSCISEKQLRFYSPSWFSSLPCSAAVLLSSFLPADSVAAVVPFSSLNTMPYCQSSSCRDDGTDSLHRWRLRRKKEMRSRRDYHQQNGRKKNWGEENVLAKIKPLKFKQ